MTVEQAPVEWIKQVPYGSGLTLPVHVWELRGPWPAPDWKLWGMDPRTRLARWTRGDEDAHFTLPTSAAAPEAGSPAP